MSHRGDCEEGNTIFIKRSKLYTKRDRERETHRIINNEDGLNAFVKERKNIYGDRRQWTQMFVRADFTRIRVRYQFSSGQSLIE